jgi:EF hand
MKISFKRLGLLACTLMASACANADAQDRTPSPDRFFEYMDRNRDGKLDADEVQRMPSSFRSSLEKSGVALDRGVSKDVFMREIPKAFEQMRVEREQRDEERRRDEPRRREDDPRRSEDRNRGDQNRGPSTNQAPAPKAPALYTPQKKVDITVKIPSRFQDGDTDGDGQIAYYEWRTWRPEERAQFKVYDKNGDGFLTPRELIKPPTSAELIAAASGTSSPQGTTATTPGTNSPAPAAVQGGPTGRGDRSFSRGGGSRRGPGGSRRDESPRPVGVSGTSSSSPAVVAVADAPAEDATTKTARVVFASMDSDKNKQITSEEWERSRRVKPKFEEAGIDLSTAMNEQQFIEAYKKAYPK